jgi:hypothetical protein
MNKSPTSASFLNVSNMFSVKSTDKTLSADRPFEPATRYWLPGNVTSLGQSFSRRRPPGQVGDERKNQGKYLTSADLKVF